MGLFLHRSGFIGGGGVGAAAGGGGGGVNPWTDQGGLSLDTFRQNSGSYDRFVIALGNGATSDGGYRVELSTDGVTSSDYPLIELVKSSRPKQKFPFINAASEYAKIRLQISSDTGLSIDSWWTQDIDGAAGSWQDFSGSRSLSTSYQNTSGYDRLVAVSSFGNNDTGISTFTLETSPDNSTWTVIASDRTASSENGFQLWGVVPDGYYVRVIRAVGSNTGAAITVWVERGLDRVSGGASDVTVSRALATSYQNTGSASTHVLAGTNGNDSTAVSVFALQSSPDNSTWTTIGEDYTESGKNSSCVFGEIPAGYYYRFHKSSGSNSTYALAFWIEQTGS